MPHADHASCDVSSDESGLLQIPLSRAQLLQVGGAGIALTLARSSLTARAAKITEAAPPYVVLIVLDGARPDYFTTPGLPHTAALMRSGTQYTNAFTGILESETPSGHVAISTGSEPRRTGIPSFWWADSENATVSLFSPEKIRAGMMERIVRRSGVPTLAGLLHGKHRKAAVVALSGSKYYAADAIGGPDADVIMYYGTSPSGVWGPTYIPGHAPPVGLLNRAGLTTKGSTMTVGTQNHLAMKLAAETFTQMRQQVTLINLPEFDWPLGHVDGGPRSPAGVKTLMQGFDRDLAMLQAAYEKAGVLQRTIFVLMADHGMMPLTHTVAAPAIEDAVQQAGTSLVTQAFTSGGYLWLKDEARILAAAQHIARLRNPYIQSVYARLRTSKGYVYRRVTDHTLLNVVGTERANQYLLNSFNGSNAPDITLVFREGVGCEPGGQASWKGDHGGTSWEAQHIPLILSGPGIRRGHVSSYPARLIDVAPTLLQLMGVPHGRMQGLTLADAMERPPSKAAGSQKVASKTLIPVVAALQQESRHDIAAGR